MPTYTVKAGDSAASVAQAIYGDQRMFAELKALNPGSWRPGRVLDLPDKKRDPFVSEQSMAAAKAETAVNAYTQMGFTASGEDPAAKLAATLGGVGTGAMAPGSAYFESEKRGYVPIGSGVAPADRDRARLARATSIYAAEGSIGLGVQDGRMVYRPGAREGGLPRPPAPAGGGVVEGGDVVQVTPGAATRWGGLGQGVPVSSGGGFGGQGQGVPAGSGTGVATAGVTKKLGPGVPNLLQQGYETLRLTLAQYLLQGNPQQQILAGGALGKFGVEAIRENAEAAGGVRPYMQGLADKALENVYDVRQRGTKGAPAGTFGLSGDLNRAQLADASRWTGQAIDYVQTTGDMSKLPLDMSIDVAAQLAGTFVDPNTGQRYKSAEDFLKAWGYVEWTPGKYTLFRNITTTGAGGGYTSGRAPSVGGVYTGHQIESYPRGGGGLTEWNWSIRVT